jgi:hypothetical protein
MDMLADSKKDGQEFYQPILSAEHVTARGYAKWPKDTLTGNWQ